MARMGKIRSSTEPAGETRLPPPPSRPFDGHKGTFGTVIVVGGCPTMIGAPALCAAAALRSGAGLVKLATTQAVLPWALTIEPSATGIVLTGRVREDLRRLDAADPLHHAVLAVGPGMGDAWPPSLVQRLLGGPRAVVLDADGLNMLARAGSARTGDAPLVLTPHPGEFRRLAQPLGITRDPTDPAQRVAAATALARAHRAVVVLKGRHTVVADASRHRINTTGNPALATAGTGDVLTGIIASLIAQGLAPFDAASLGTHLHGLAADDWATMHGDAGMTASELATLLPGARQRMGKPPAKQGQRQDAKTPSRQEQ